MKLVAEQRLREVRLLLLQRLGLADLRGAQPLSRRVVTALRQTFLVWESSLVCQAGAATSGRY